MIRLAHASLSALALVACAGGSSAEPELRAHFRAARLLEGATIPASAAPGARRAGTHSSSVEAINAGAVPEPNAEYYAGEVQVYPWSEGALYRLHGAPGRVSDIALEPGETLVSVAAGDTVRWIIGDTSSGSGASRRTHILVKPSAAGLTTNLVISTARRVYHIEAESRARGAMTSISWTYPEGALIALGGLATTATDPPVATGIAIDSLNFDYRIEGASPPWRPLRAFDDGRQSFIQFPPTLGESEAPPLFIVGEGGRLELVNYRLRGRYYVVDRLFSAAELRFGEKHQEVVRIVRAPAVRRGS